MRKIIITAAAALAAGYAEGAPAPYADQIVTGIPEHLFGTTEHPMLPSEALKMLRKYPASITNGRAAVIRGYAACGGHYCAIDDSRESSLANMPGLTLSTDRVEAEMQYLMECIDCRAVVYGNIVSGNGAPPRIEAERIEWTSKPEMPK
ncbi:MAG TPA: hypothetical protein VKG65_12515 [Terriglobales bacterium]|nr:hypothetical protein [Terriglobales bacterium]